MKYIEIPPPVTLERIDGLPIEGPTGKLQVTFREFVEGRLRDHKWGKSADALMAAVEIRSLLHTAADGVLALETEHWKMLLDATNDPSPQQQYNPEIAHCLVKFIHAIRKAEDKLPDHLQVTAN